jgi:hypothetical protein
MEPDNVLEKALCERPSMPLYHYTTAQGLIGIFNEGLWASSAYHLNDSKEFGYAIDLVRDTLQNNLRHERGPNNEAYGKILEALETIKTYCQVFIASLSEEDDLLSQWQSYCSGLDGYAIGFKRAHFRPALSDGFSFIRCRYTPKEQMDIVHGVISLLTKIIVNGEDDQRLVSMAFAGAFAGLASIKHPGFRSEKEWRLVKAIVTAFVDQSEKVNFRQGRGGIVPFLVAKLHQSRRVGFRPVSITIGPNTDPQAAKSALEMFLAKKQLFGFLTNSVKIKVSETPLRP